MTFTEPQPFAEALKKLDERTIALSPLRSAEWREKVAAGLRDRAFFSSTLENARVAQSMKDFIGDFLAKSIDPGTGGLKAGSRAEFVAEMRELCIREGLGSIDPETGKINPEIDESDLTDLRSMSRLQLIFDVQTESAHEYGFWAQGNDPDLLYAYPAQRFLRIRPVRAPRPLHEANNGVVRRKDDMDFWLSMNPDFGVPYGPWGFGSGMGVEDVDRIEAEELGLIAPGEEIASPERELNDRLSAGVRDLDSETKEELRRIFGPQVRESNGRMEWTGIAPKDTAPVSAPAQIVPQETPAVNPDSESKVSTKITQHSKSTKVQRQGVEEVVAIIDKVHKDGPLASSVVRWGKGTGGSYDPSKKSEIKIGKDNPLWRSQLVHEIGHKLDLEGLPGWNYSSVSSQEVQSVMTAISQSAAVQNLQSDPGYQSSPSYLKYQLRPQELWARAYAQYVAEESGDSDLLSEIQARQSGQTGYWADSQWSSDDFAPIRQQINTLFQTLGWEA